MRRREFSLFAIASGVAGLLPRQLFAQGTPSPAPSPAPAAPNPAAPALAPGAAAALAEGLTSGKKHVEHKTGPIVDTWNFKAKHDKDKSGSVNLTINPDGSWNYSGSFPPYKDHDLDIVMGVKSSEGSTVIFQYAADASNGLHWNEQGRNETLKDNFKAFSIHDWYASYRTPLDRAGVAKQYAEREARKKKLKAEELAKEEAKERQEAQAAAQRAAQQQQSGGGGGGGGIMGTVGPVLATLGGTLLSFL